MPTSLAATGMRIGSTGAAHVAVVAAAAIFALRQATAMIQMLRAKLLFQRYRTAAIHTLGYNSRGRGPARPFIAPRAETRRRETRNGSPPPRRRVRRDSARNSVLLTRARRFSAVQFLGELIFRLVMPAVNPPLFVYALPFCAVNAPMCREFIIYRSHPVAM